MPKKIFKTLDEQIEILRFRGLIIEDVDKARSILFRENYFFISGYRHLFMRSLKDNQFHHVCDYPLHTLDHDTLFLEPLRIHLLFQ